MIVELFIPELPKLPNTLLGARWFVRSANAKRWMRLIGDSIVTYKGDFWLVTELPLRKSVIHLTRRSPRQCDFDGLVGSFKPVLDALVKLLIIEDDSPNHIECSYEWAKVPRKEQGIVVSVEAPSLKWKNFQNT